MQRYNGKYLFYYNLKNRGNLSKELLEIVWIKGLIMEVFHFLNESTSKYLISRHQFEIKTQILR